ncbi:MAG: transcription-repair coupling factor, partial [Bacteroidia bacterium]|nr:transcription-repair coupling factor [Bacteroidia bacterium]
MRSFQILPYFEQYPVLRTLAQHFSDRTIQRKRLRGAVGSEVAFSVLSVLLNRFPSAVWICTDQEQARYLRDDLETISRKHEILYFPSSFKRPYQIEEIENANVLQRAEVMTKVLATSFNWIVVTYPEAISEKVIRPKILQNNTLALQKGDTLGRNFIVEVLENYGFEAVDFVY